MSVNPKEIQEARVVAHQVLDLLHDVERQLKSARNWGIYDMFRGGMFASLIKHSKIDKAEALFHRVRIKLEELQKELSDVAVSFGPGVQISGFERFMDIAFDNIISDWMVQSKISNSLGEVARIRADVYRVLETLDGLERKQGT